MEQCTVSKSLDPGIYNSWPYSTYISVPKAIIEKCSFFPHIYNIAIITSVLMYTTNQTLVRILSIVEKISRRKAQNIIRDSKKARHLKERAQALVTGALKLDSLL